VWKSNSRPSHHLVSRLLLRKSDAHRKEKMDRKSRVNKAAAKESWKQRRERQKQEEERKKKLARPKRTKKLDSASKKSDFA
jgi:hypothetical protein